MLLLLAGCAPWLPTRQAAPEAQVVQATPLMAWVSLRTQQAPDAARQAALLAEARAQLSRRLTALSRKPVDEEVARHPAFMRRTLAAMGWQPLQIDPPVQVVQAAWQAKQGVFDLQAQVDLAAWVAQLRRQVVQLDEKLARFKRVPDRVNTLRQLRALLPAWPLLLQRQQLRTLLWRFDAESRLTKADRMARMLRERLRTLDEALVVEVDTEIERRPAFARLLRAALRQEGFSDRAGPADLFVFYEVQDDSAHRVAGGVAVHYAVRLKLADGDGAPFAEYALESAATAETEKLARQQAMSQLAESVVDRLVNKVLLAEYRLMRQKAQREENDKDALHSGDHSAAADHGGGHHVRAGQS